MIEQKYINKFWNKVKKDKEDECWIWLASIRNPKDGYGQFRYKNKMYSAHVFAFMLANNIILTGSDIIIRHKCNNPPCCNPNHLIEGTQKDNIQDSIKNKTHHCMNQYGENNFHSKLTKEEVRKIRRLGWFIGAKKIAKMSEFKNKIGISGITSILNNYTWKHI